MHMVDIAYLELVVYKVCIAYLVGLLVVYNLIAQR